MIKINQRISTSLRPTHFYRIFNRKLFSISGQYLTRDYCCINLLWATLALGQRKEIVLRVPLLLKAKGTPLDLVSRREGPGAKSQ